MEQRRQTVTVRWMQTKTEQLEMQNIHGATFYFHCLLCKAIPEHFLCLFDKLYLFWLYEWDMASAVTV